MSTATARHQRHVDKFDERRAQLAASALATLAEVGYARASLREIATKSPFSHGVVHYYFANKNELIVHSVREYKAVCVTRYDEVIEHSTADDFVRRFADRLVETLHEDTPMHRLWYDLRTASMFDAELRRDIMDIDKGLEHMVERIVRRYAELQGRAPAYDAATAYALLDGVFEHAVLQQLADDELAGPTLHARAMALMPLMLA